MMILSSAKLLFLFLVFILESTDGLNILDSKAYLINLKDRTDKLAVSKFQLDLLGLNFTPVEGINGNQLKNLSSFSLDDELIGKSIGIPDLKLTMRAVKTSKLNNPQLGCFLSHLKVFNEIANQQGDSMSLIFEDDFLADGSAIQLMNDYIKQLPSDWDLLYVGHCDGRHVCKNYLNSEKSLCYSEALVVCVHAYLLKSKSVAKKLFDTANSIEPTNADFYFQKAGIKTYVVFPHIFTQRKNIKADINSPYGMFSKLNNDSIANLVNKLF